jgi:hypothetical protein
MGIAEDWSDLLFDLTCLSKQVAKRKFRKSIKYGWGGLCAYCRCNRATTLDHLKPKSRGGSSLRSNLIPACRECNHSKGSQSWLVWFQEQTFYNETAKELIEEWISNKRFIEEEVDESVNPRAKVCITESSLRSEPYEPPCFGENRLAPA